MMIGKKLFYQVTLSGTQKGRLPHSANALSQVMVARACGSWLPWTITTTGRDIVHNCRGEKRINLFVVGMPILMVEYTIRARLKTRLIGPIL